MAPFPLTTSRTIKYKEECKNRWLAFAGCKDDTLICYDYKTNKIVKMKKDSVDLSMKKWKSMSEEDYEGKIINEWNDFDTFFTSETKRISLIVKQWLLDEETYKLDDLDRIIYLWEKV